MTIQEQTLTLSQKERERLNVLHRLHQDELRCADAAESVGIGERQLYRSRARYKSEGDEGVIHRLRGCLSNHGYRHNVRTRVLVGSQIASNPKFLCST